MTHYSPDPFIPAPASETAHLPAIIDQLPPNSAHPPQTQFTRSRQAAFLRLLADSGEVRVAARASNVSHQTVYRMRRACYTFRTGWDAALIVARERAEELLASRAMHGVEEQVFYHGEVVATRRRYDSRLLLAHLARLDRMAERADVADLAGAFDDVIAAFEGAGEEEVPDLSGVPAQAGTACSGAQTKEAPACAGAHGGGAQTKEAPACAGAHGGNEETSPRPCNMRSMSALAEHAGDDLEPTHNDEPLPELEQRLRAMEAARPSGALLPHEHHLDSHEPCAIEAVQLAAFEAGEARWWEALPLDEGEDEFEHDPGCGEGARGDLRANAGVV